MCVSCVYFIPLCSVYISAYLAGGKTPDISSQLGAFWPCSGVENVFALSGEDGIDSATKRGMSGSKLRSNTETKTPTLVAFQIGGIGEVILSRLSICKVCMLFSESMDELLRQKEC